MEEFNIEGNSVSELQVSFFFQAKIYISLSLFSFPKFRGFSPTLLFLIV
jgi:hypothetical protein